MAKATWCVENVLFSKCRLIDAKDEMIRTIPDRSKIGEHVAVIFLLDIIVQNQVSIIIAVKAREGKSLAIDRVTFAFDAGRFVVLLGVVSLFARGRGLIVVIGHNGPMFAFAPHDFRETCFVGEDSVSAAVVWWLMKSESLIKVTVA